MCFTITPPREIKRGLHVEVIEDPSDYFCMTSFDIRFTLLGEEKIGGEYLKVIKNAFYQSVSKTNYKKHIINFGNIDGTGIYINISDHITKEDSIKLVIEMCNEFLAIKTIVVNPKAYSNPHAGIAYFNGAQTIIKEYLKDITENNMYEYEETKL